jgi:EAL domain-containing protein (putative c-di-GMP-specific phosphodiesterase class I)
MGLGAGAVGVENVQQRDKLLQLGCRQFQGDFFGAPAPLGQFEARMAAMASQPHTRTSLRA